MTWFGTAKFAFDVVVFAIVYAFAFWRGQVAERRARAARYTTLIKPVRRRA